MNKFQAVWKRWCETGLKWPHAFDNDTGKPSVTLLMFYFATIIMFTAEITNLFLGTLLIPTIVTVFVCFMTFVMYRLRKIDRFKFDLDDQEIEVENSSEETEQKEDKE